MPMSRDVPSLSRSFARTLRSRVQQVLGRNLNIKISSYRSFTQLLDVLNLAIAQRDEAIAANVQISPDGVTQEDVLRCCSLFAPFHAEGVKKTRVGNKHDGGYVFLDDFADIAMVVSCGISNDVTCDVAFAEMGKDVLQFDHTIDAPPVPHRRFQFHKQAIDADGRIPGSATLWDITERAGDTSKADLLLKIDVEGEEWPTFAKFPPEIMQRYRQIACEFHWSSRMRHREHFERCLRAIENIRTSFFPTHLHANNFGRFSIVLGVPMPEVFEVTFANNRFYRPSERQHRGPDDIDNPNNPDVPDLYLGSPFCIY